MGDMVMSAGETSIVFDRQQNMSRPTAVGNKDRSPLRRLFGAAGILIEFTAA